MDEILRVVNFSTPPGLLDCHIVLVTLSLVRVNSEIVVVLHINITQWNL